MQAAQVHIFPTAERVPRYFVLQSAVPPRLSCVQPLVPTTSQLPSKRVEALARAIECAAAIKTYSPMNYLRQMSYGILPEFERPHERGIKPEPTVPQAVPDIHVDQRKTSDLKRAGTRQTIQLLSQSSNLICFCYPFYARASAWDSYQ